MSFFLSLLVFVLFSSSARSAETIHLYAAASFAAAAEKLAEIYIEKHELAKTKSADIKVIAASSATLARQIVSGAHADIFISAHRAWIETLKEERLVSPHRVKAIIKNRLVLASLHDDGQGKGLTRILSLKKRALALGDPAFVPAGLYAKEALQNAQLWGEAQKRALFASDARTSLFWLLRGEAELGILYESDASAYPQLHVIHIFGEKDHTPIVYFAALLEESSLEGKDFYHFLQSSEAQALLIEEGFCQNLPACDAP